MLIIIALSIFHILRTLSRKAIIIALIPIAMVLIMLYSIVSPSSQPVVVHLSETSSPTSQQSIPLQENHQLNKIIDTLIGAGDFTGWANILSATDPSTLPITATLLIPTNDAIAKKANSTRMFAPVIPYHIVPQRLTFSDLRKYHVLSKLPTLLPTKFIVVTNDSAENFMIDGTRITHPDLYLTGSLSVHGVMDVLDYKVFGNGVLKNGTLTKNETSNVEKKKEPENSVGGGVEVSFGGFLGGVFCICVALVTVYFFGGEFSTHPLFWQGLGSLLMLAYMTYLSSECSARL